MIKISLQATENCKRRLLCYHNGIYFIMQDCYITSLSHPSKRQFCLHNLLTSVTQLEDSNSNIHKVVLAMLQGRLHGIVTCEHHKMQGLKSEAVGWNSDVRKNIALCNDLVPLAKNIVAGTLEEKKAFTDVEAIFVVTLLFYSDPESRAGSVHQQDHVEQVSMN